jgi:SAM-dependent methyltransferase
MRIKSSVAVMNMQNPGLWYSLRRYYVDEFYSRRARELAPGSLVLDLGGKKIRKRGRFDIDRYGLNVVYLNLSRATRPDVLADVSALPLQNERFDAIICSELLEHVSDPIPVLQESYRLLRKGGELLICVPFLFRIHADPLDYARYTDFYWNENLAKIGYNTVKIEKQGFFWSVLVDMLREMAFQLQKEGKPRSPRIRRLVDAAVHRIRRYAIWLDLRPEVCQPSIHTSYTTGFGIQALKS